MTREEAIERLKRKIDCIENGALCSDFGSDKEVFDMAIKALEQEPKTGHWRAIYQGDEIIDYRCSECEFGSTFGKSPYRMNYCPNCGAKMVEPQESEDKE
jgi:DNA-directed RNA polymerase subunit RPC12/RpoP